MSSEKYISDAFFGCGERFYGDLRKKLHKYICADMSNVHICVIVRSVLYFF